MTKDEKEKLEFYLYSYMTYKNNNLSRYINYDSEDLKQLHLRKSEAINHQKEFLSNKKYWTDYPDGYAENMLDYYSNLCSNIDKEIEYFFKRLKERHEINLKIIDASSSLTPIEKAIVQSRFNGAEYPRLTPWKSICKEFSYGRTQLNKVYNEALEKINEFFFKSEQK